MVLAALTSPLHLTACTTREVIDHSQVDAGVTGDTGRPDALDPDADLAPGLRALPAELVVDGDVHTGAYTNGTAYVGVYGDVVTYRLSDLPELAPLAMLHAPIMARRAGLDVSAEELVAHVVWGAGVGCADARPVGGCMALLRDPHLAELAALAPDRFDGVTQDALADPDAFGLSVAAYIWRASYARAVFGIHTDDVSGHIDGHPEPGQAGLYRLYGHAYGPYESQLGEVFDACAHTSLPECLEGIDRPDSSRADLLRGFANVAAALAEAPRATTAITRDQVERYVASLAPLHAAPAGTIERVLDARFADGPISTPDATQDLFEALTAALGAPYSPASIRATLCARAVLNGPPACP